MSAPPYALAVPAFEFLALAALTGRAALGSGREVAVACLCAARLAGGALPPLSLPPTVRAERAASGRLWLASLTLPAPVRPVFTRLVDASAESDRAVLAETVRELMRVVEPHLDASALAELDRLARRCSA